MSTVEQEIRVGQRVRFEVARVEGRGYYWETHECTDGVERKLVTYGEGMNEWFMVQVMSQVEEVEVRRSDGKWGNKLVESGRHAEVRFPWEGSVEVKPEMMAAVGEFLEKELGDWFVHDREVLASRSAHPVKYWVDNVEGYWWQPGSDEWNNLGVAEAQIALPLKPKGYGRLRD